MRKIRALVIHHSASGSAGVDVNTIRQWHKAKGWRDVGYGRVITADGIIQQGRPDDQVEAHVSPSAGIAPFGRNWNRLTMGICCVGDFEKHTVPAAQWAALVDACTRLCARYGLTYRDIYSHREATRPGYTVCPGRHLNMAKLRQEVGAKE